MAKFPVIGDEAYYYYWGAHPAGGYYDLPPMIGWWNAAMSWLSNSVFWLRVPNLIVMLLVAFGIREWTKGVLGDLGSSLLGLIFFFLPVPFAAVLMAPDLPLLFFTFYASVLFFTAQKRWEVFLSGALWGAAFLSKYFAVFTLPVFLVWTWKRPDRLKSVWAPFLLGASPFVFQHLLWNQQHCWANFIFNLVTRQKVSDGPWLSVVGWFLVYLVVSSTPFLWSGFFKRRSEPDSSAQSLEKFAGISWMLPLAFFGATALLGKGQGLHWYVPYMPFFVIWVGLRVNSVRGLKWRAWGVLLIASVIGTFGLGVIQTPDTTLKLLLQGRHAFEYELAVRPDPFFEQLQPSLNGMHVIALEGYSLASVYHFESQRRWKSEALPVTVFGSTSRFGRVFDFSTPWNSFEGKNILFLARSEWSSHDFARFFETTESKWVEHSGQRYWVSKGIGFKSELYRNEVIERIKREFYPNFLGLPARCEW